MQQISKLTSLCLSLIAAAVILPTASVAGTCCPQPEPTCCPTCTSPGLKDGFYVGIGAGYDSYRLHHSTSVNTSDNSLAISDSRDRNATGWMGSLFAGYGMYFQNVYYLGAEIFGNDSAAESSSSTAANVIGVPIVNNTNKVSIDASYGISLLPGYKINCDTLLYARLGYTRARFKDQISNILTSGNANNWYNGLTYGLGLEASVAANLSLRGEYTHTNYGSLSNSFTAVSPEDGTIYTNTSKLSPSDNQFMLSLIYHIC